jgi:hypothetical protein
MRDHHHELVVFHLDQLPEVFTSGSAPQVLSIERNDIPASLPSFSGSQVRHPADSCL